MRRCRNIQEQGERSKGKGERGKGKGARSKGKGKGHGARDVLRTLYPKHSTLNLQALKEMGRDGGRQESLTDALFDPLHHVGKDFGGYGFLDGRIFGEQTCLTMLEEVVERRIFLD